MSALAPERMIYLDDIIAAAAPLQPVRSHGWPFVVAFHERMMDGSVLTSVSNPLSHMSRRR